MYILKQKNKGFTLIELVLVTGIISLLFTFSLVNLGGYRKITSKIDSEILSNSILNFINNSKEYCRDNEIRGHIYFNSDNNSLNNSMTLNCGSEQVNKLLFPEGFVLEKERMPEEILIDSRGITASSCTIKFSDREGKIHEISMCVGTEYVDIKN
ncbi:type II secretion system GspH family protein [Clostridium sp. CX1]|uniref:type II secretion system protein n=1 Tax=Clostridium sp. CX1 TaxID=2978346 RepID=UPI0021C06EA6|nr:type II secretion system protein [Clostridium sp. CX1]MCT8976048.1 type II secretion system GspH family protein [Clostridium sp. CX1]